MNYSCVRCNQPLANMSALDPRGLHQRGEEPRYMHPECADAERADMKAEQCRVEKAALELLEACEAALPALNWASVHQTGDRLHLVEVIGQIERAIASAKGE
jgi:hypothetical protein